MLIGLYVLAIAGLVLAVLPDRRLHAPLINVAGHRLSSLFLGLSIAAAIAAAIYFILWPAYADGRTLLDANGARILLPLFAPVVLASLPALASPSRRRRTCGQVGALLALLCVIGGFSIGAGYIPAAALLVIAAAFPATPSAVGP